MNNTHSTADSLNRTIDQHAAGAPIGKVETHDLNSLCARLFAPRGVVEKLLAAGVIRAQSAIHANDASGLHAFLSDDLNEVRRSVLAAIVEKIVEESDGLEPSQVTLAASNALNEHVKGFAKKPGDKREFAAFPVGLVQLSRYGEEEPHLAERAAGTVAKGAAVAGAGALAYGGASWLRGRKPGLSPLGALRAGHTANAADLKKIGGRIGGSITSGATKVAAVLAGRRPA